MFDSVDELELRRVKDGLVVVPLHADLLLLSLSLLLV